MKKRIVGYILLLVVTLLCLTGCDDVKTVKQETSTSEESMFVLVQHSYTTHSSWDVVYHRDTKVMYIINARGGIQTMVNADGTPMIYEAEDE